MALRSTGVGPHPSTLWL